MWFCSGLAIVFAENAPGTAAVDKPTRKLCCYLCLHVLTLFTEAWSELCPAYNKFEGLQ